MRFGRHAAAIASASVALLADAPAALAGNGGFAPVPPESPNAEGISQSWWFVTAFVLAIFLLVEVLLVVFVVRYRRRNRPRDADGAQVHGANRLEIAWTIAPVVILFAIAAFVFAKLPGIQDVPAATGGEENLVVEVTGTQFTWEFRYPNGVIAIDRLRAPEGRTVELEVTAPDWDVVHSWWIPALGGKIDAIPGKVNTTWFEREPLRGLPRAVRRALRDLPREDARVGGGACPADEFDAWLEERSSAAGRRHVAPRRGAVGGRVREVPRPRRRGGIRAAHRRDRARRGPRGPREAPPRGPRRDAAGRPRLDRRRRSTR